MGIPIFDELEKLINERGSANILRERNAFAKDQYSALEKELSLSKERELAAKAREAELKTENLRLKLDNEQLTVQIRNLEERIHNDNLLTLKYGVYWDKEGNSYCPKCKTPTSSIGWVIHASQHFHGLKCSCSEKPFLLTDKGTPIHATDAMKFMSETAKQQ